MPTRPLLPGTFAVSQAIVSKVSLDSSMSAGSGLAWLCGRMSTNSPSDMKAPRTSWFTKM
jgi:uncharacterized membrane protein